jgi:hypothetical protein
MIFSPPQQKAYGMCHPVPLAHRNPRSKWHVIAPSLAWVLLACACSGSSTVDSQDQSKDAGIPSDGSAEVDATPDSATPDSATPDSATPDSATADAGPCDPIGTWKLTTQLDAAAPFSENIVVTESDAGISVDFVDREIPPGSCWYPPDAEPPEPTAEVSGAFDASTCELVAQWEASYCTSGEDQCVTIAYSLVISGDTASGTLNNVGGECMHPYSSEESVTGVRVIP